MNCNFIYDEEIREIICFNGLFSLFAFHFQIIVLFSWKTMDILQ